MTEDLTVFFNVTEHATSAALDNVEVAGIFDNGYMGALGGVVGTTDPTYTLPTAATRRTLQGSPLRIIDGPHAGNRYTVTSVEPDGAGVTTLRLQRVTVAA
jgi:hypothetical protein